MKQLIIIAFLLVLFGCIKESQSKSTPSNTAFEIELLFEHDGCKVYRFYDGRYVYYTDCRGTTQQEYKSGKSTYYDDVTNSGRK